MYINDLFLSFQRAEGRQGWMQHPDSQQPCSHSQTASRSHTVFESLSLWKLPTVLNPFLVWVNATLMRWSLSSVTRNVPKRPADSCQSFCINAAVFPFSFFFSCGEKTAVTGFLKFRLSALPDKFGEIKIFPAQSINTHYKQASGRLKIC